jgi:hypothetical protein
MNKHTSSVVPAIFSVVPAIFSVVPAKAGTQVFAFKTQNLDSRFRGNDGESQTGFSR